jgi:hypothetical protein
MAKKYSKSELASMEKKYIACLLVSFILMGVSLLFLSKPVSIGVGVVGMFFTWVLNFSFINHEDENV